MAMSRQLTKSLPFGASQELGPLLGRDDHQRAHFLELRSPDLGDGVDIDFVLGQQPFEERLQPAVAVVHRRRLKASGEQGGFEIVDVVGGDLPDLERALAAGEKFAERCMDSPYVSSVLGLAPLARSDRLNDSVRAK